MNEEKIIHKFLTTNYRLEYNNSGMYFVDRILFENKHFPNEFKKLFHKVFDVELIDHLLTWIDKEQKTIFQPFDDFLVDYGVELGITDWMAIKLSGKPIDFKQEDFVKHFEHRYTHEFIEYYYNRWFNEQKIKITEKTMKIDY